MSDFNTKLIEEFRANGGQVNGMFAGTPLLLLTSIGAKSGRERTAPLAYTTDGDAYVIVASKGGAPTNPDWYFNLKANPTVTVELGGETFRATADEAGGEERDRLYGRMVEALPGFAEYQRNTIRRIPVFTLRRTA